MWLFANAKNVVSVEVYKTILPIVLKIHCPW